MEKRIVSTLMLILLLISMLTLVFNLQPVNAEPRTWTVDDDGPADFHTIQEAIEVASSSDTIYVYNGTYYENVIVNKNNLTLVGENKYSTVIDGNWIGDAVLISANNTRVVGFTIQNSGWGSLESGVRVESASGSSISQNIIIDNQAGILLRYSSDNEVTNNTAILNGYGGITLLSSNNNIVVNNTASYNEYGISLSKALYGSSYSNTVTGNTASYNEYGISLWYTSNYNSITCNNVSDNNYGIFFFDSSFNQIFHNNFIDNTVQVDCTESMNVWDNSYPSCGNYWSDHVTVDDYSGANQNELGSDGIVDDPYIIDDYSKDNYPLVEPWASPDIALTGITLSKTIVSQGYDMDMDVTVQNQGNKIEGFDVRVCANSTEIQTQYVLLRQDNLENVTFTWNTTGFAKGNYTISAYAVPALGEIDMGDNNYTLPSDVLVTIPGDVDGNGTINIFDLSIVGVAYGCFRLMPCYNPYADITEDGVVDARDAAIVTFHYGETDP